MMVGGDGGVIPTRIAVVGIELFRSWQKVGVLCSSLLGFAAIQELCACCMHTASFS
jgi:hypothetical protein